jgi:16S rRNA (guanine1207-N2)-methyltransferase
VSDPIQVSLLPPFADRFRTDRLLDGKLVVLTPFGLNTLNRLLIEGSADSPARSVLGLMLPDALPLVVFGMLHPAPSERPEAAGSAPKPTKRDPAGTVPPRPADSPPGRSILYYHLDLYNVEMARETARRNEFDAFQAVCAPDIPVLPRPPDLVFFAFGSRSETALVCEMLRQAHARLAVGGHLLAAVQNPKDTWLRRQIEKVFGNLSLVRKEKDGLLYSAKRKGEVPSGEEPAAPAHFVREIEVAFAGETLGFESCYGIFSNAGLDNGSLALLEVLEPPEPCRSILDLGCGWGALGILASRRLEPRRLTLTDANARASDVARRNAERHARAQKIQVRLECDTEGALRTVAAAEAGTYDLVVSNPPYSTEFRVTAMFLRAARLALRPGGTAWFVTKTNPLLEARMREWFGNVRVVKRRGYSVFVATKRAK